MTRSSTPPTQRVVEALELANRYIKTFHEDMRALGCVEADVEPRVSTHMDEIITMVEQLIERHAYEVEGDVLRRPQALELRCAEPSRPRRSARRRTGRARRAQTRPARLCALESEEARRAFLDVALGEGRLGWHIECSAMSSTHLGCDFDIHGGGSDLIFPHHENEIAQSECATGERYVRHWMHNGFVNIDNEKMSKSLGNFFTIREVERFSGEAIRYFLLTTHYRAPINFSDAPLIEAADRIVYLYETLARADDGMASGNPELEPLELVAELQLSQRLEQALCEDLNTCKVLALLSDALRTINALAEQPPATKAERKRVPASLRALRQELEPVLSVLGIGESDPQPWLDARRTTSRARGIDPAEIEAQIAARQSAKLERDFAKADALREALASQGIELLDKRAGTVWRFLT